MALKIFGADARLTLARLFIADQVALALRIVGAVELAVVVVIANLAGPAVIVLQASFEGAPPKHIPTENLENMTFGTVRIEGAIGHKVLLARGGLVGHGTILEATARVKGDLLDDADEGRLDCLLVVAWDVVLVAAGAPHCHVLQVRHSLGSVGTVAHTHDIGGDTLLVHGLEGSLYLGVG
ncbi:MAG: hypothetical protein ACPG4T_06105 [Nannocystaceae bacterium]